jgi:hypothetical protein
MLLETQLDHEPLIAAERDQVHPRTARELQRVELIAREIHSRSDKTFALNGRGGTRSAVVIVPTEPDEAVGGVRSGGRDRRVPDAAPRPVGDLASLQQRPADHQRTSAMRFLEDGFDRLGDD